jgi:hypothetical protein
MIDIHTERLLPVKDLPAYLESRGLGKRISMKTVNRWILTGCEGVRLEVVRFGGIIATSYEAVQRWADRQARALDADAAPRIRPAPRRSSAPPAPDSRPGPQETVRILTEHRLIPTEVDKLIGTIELPPGSSGGYVATVLFRCGFRKLADLQRSTIEKLLSIQGIGKRSAPVIRALWAAVSSMAEGR